jgi:enediyne biosynthesis protein E3
VVESFVAGYNYAIAPWAGQDPADLPAELRGFAVEGAAMSSALADIMTFSGGRRLRALSHDYGDHYAHLIHVGAGWAFARLRRQPWRGVRFGEPVLRWLAWDGWGFHQTFFGAHEILERQFLEPAARGEVRPIRDQGAGRALWFYAGADPARIAAIIGQFPEPRRSDLWAGIGLAASYTGAQPPAVVEKLARAADGYRDHLAQGSAFAAKAHLLAGQVPAASARAIEVLAGVQPAIAAGWTDACFREVAADGGDSVTTYQRWRARIRDAFLQHQGGDIHSR